MRIVLITPWYSRNMGYSENFLPAALASNGCEVHVASSNAQVYYRSPGYSSTYEPFLGPPIVECGEWDIDGYHLHRLPYKSQLRSMPGIHGLTEFLNRLNPDIVQTFEVDHSTTYDAALFVKSGRAKLFTESHRHASVFGGSIRARIIDMLEKRVNRFRSDLQLINRVTTLCYPIAPDVLELAASFYFVPREKMKLQSLGVDTRLFRTLNDQSGLRARQALRQQLGFSDNEIVAIYTGRFTEEKNPFCLAEAVQLLRGERHPYRALFVGHGGEQAVNALQKMDGSVVQPFVPVQYLPDYYQASDIGVWPRQESTSQLDAVACGLPIIISNRATVVERIIGNGLSYEENNPHDLAEKLKELANSSTRERMGRLGSQKVKSHYSWDAIAQARILDYERALKS